MARANSRKTRRYSNEFKSKAVQFSYQKGVEVQQVADSLGIHPFLLSKWRKQFRDGKLDFDKRLKLDKEVSELNRIETLKKEVEQLKKENSLLKKYQRFLGEKRMSASSSSRETGRSLA
jgi:transposase